MIAVTIVAFLLFVARMGYWACVVVSIVLGSLVFATIPAMIIGSPRFVFAIAGAIAVFVGGG